jgi:uncharacterized protein YkwD
MSTDTTAHHPQPFGTRSRRSAARFALVGMVTTLVVGLAPAPPAEALTANQVRNRLYDKVNKARDNHGMRRLRANTTIQHGAKRHTRTMADSGALFHDAALFNEVNKVSRQVWWAGENVGLTSTGKGAVKRLHRAFMGSSGHRANILNRRATHMGFGVVTRNGRVYVTQRFVDLTR